MYVREVETRKLVKVFIYAYRNEQGEPKEVPHGYKWVSRVPSVKEEMQFGNQIYIVKRVTHHVYSDLPDHANLEPDNNATLDKKTPLAASIEIEFDYWD